MAVVDGSKGTAHATTIANQADVVTLGYGAKGTSVGDVAIEIINRSTSGDLYAWVDGPDDFSVGATGSEIVTPALPVLRLSTAAQKVTLKSTAAVAYTVRRAL